MFERHVFHANSPIVRLLLRSAARLGLLRFCGVALVCGAAAVSLAPPAASAPSTPDDLSSERGSADHGEFRTVTLDMQLISFSKKVISVTAGELVRFELRNTSDIPHEFTIGTPVVQDGRRAVLTEMTSAERLIFVNPAAGTYDSPSSVLVLPGQTKYLMWKFTNTQNLEFGCNLPGHYEMGMQGKFDVAAAETEVASEEQPSRDENKPAEVAEPEAQPELPAEEAMLASTEPAPGDESDAEEVAEPVSTPEQPAEDVTPAPSETASDEPPASDTNDPVETAEPASQPELPAEEATPASLETASDELAPGDENDAEEVAEPVGTPEQPAEDVAPAPSETASDAPPPADNNDPVEVAKPEVPPSQPAEKASPAPRSTQKAETPPRPRKKTAAVRSSGVIQLSSQRSARLAWKSWRRLARKHARILANKRHFIVRANLGEHGVFYRLRVTGFDSSTALYDACAAIRDGGDACISIPRRR